MVSMSYMMLLTSHMMVPTITLFGTQIFIYYLNLIYIKNQIVPTSHMMVLISHLIVPIEWVPYPQRECE